VVYGELGNWDGDTATDDRGVGAILGNLFDGKYGAFGIHLREETALLGQGDASTHPGAGYYGWDPNANTNHAFEVMWGKKFGAMSLGLQLNRSYARLEGDPTIGDDFFGIYNDIEGDAWESFGPVDLNYHRNILGFGAGVGYEMSPTFNFEGSFLFQSRTFMAKDTLYDRTLPGGIKAENDGSGAYQVALRGLWQWQPNVLVVPVFKYFSFKTDASVNEIWSDSTTFTYTPVEDDYSGWQVGLAGNWAINEKDLFVLGATVAKNTNTYKVRGVTVDEGGAPLAYLGTDDEYTETLMPMVFAALETHVNPWLTLRFGAQQGAFYTLKSDTKDLDSDGVIIDQNVTTEHYSPFTMMLGAGFKFGNLQLDATLHPDFVHDGPYFISGETTSAMFPKVTATYTF